MKYIFALILCVFVVVLSISVDLESRYKDYDEKTEVVIYFQNEKIKELEKEIRLLKTDLVEIVVYFKLLTSWGEK